MTNRFQLKKFISLFLVIGMLLQLVPVLPDAQAAFTQHESLGQAKLDCYHKVYLEDGVYYLDLEFNAEFYEHNQSENSKIPGRGYFTANYDGWYLVELWGGDGADGIADGNYQPGQGGKGGYVYAKVYLKEGQTLYYSLGGDGSLTYISGQGGGANGGGHGGSAVTHGVGGGGGYSALFLFEPGEFEQHYIDADHNLIGDNISDYHRATKYLMIAGGGGGGGGARGATLGGGSNISTADGGSGGSMTSPSGIIEAVGATVAGTYYAGGDGKSSGTSVEYIGHGGTNVPGRVAQTAWSWAEGELPNDWVGAHNSATFGGSGGAGNLRGGGGGGGFCGGSGGVQQSYISPTQVGGGGGGSSFVAAYANEHPVVTNLLNDQSDDPTAGITPDEAAIFDKTNPSQHGGAVSITFLAEEYQDFSNMGDLDISFQLSPYFNLEAFTMDPPAKVIDSETEGNETRPVYNIDFDDATGKINITDISLIPSAANPAGHLKLSIGLTPKNTFAGGNDVPMLVGDCVTVTEGDHPENSCTMQLTPDSCYANVPLNFNVDARSHLSNTPLTGDDALAKTTLYNDHYADVRDTLDAEAPGSMYYFIESIGNHTVEGFTENVVGSGKMDISKTTEFPVSITVTPKDNPAINPRAGEPVSTTVITDKAVVTILGQHQGHLNGQLMEISKQLTYNEAEKTYQYTLHTKADTSHSSNLPSPIPIMDASDGDTIVIPHTGTYLVQVWGGNGHDGQTFGKFQGGTGGKGGYTYVYLKLTAGTVLNLTQLGRLGDVPDNSQKKGGGGGTYTQISLGNEVLAIAGGGGGGGNGYVGLLSGLLGGRDGEHGKPTDASGNPSLVPFEDIVSLPKNKNDYASTFNGKVGGVGSLGWFTYNAGPGGARGGNYRSTASGHYTSTTGAGTSLAEGGVVDQEALAVLTSALAKKTNPNTTGNGAVLVTCLKMEDHEHVSENLTNYGLDVQFSPYFDVIAVTSVNIDTETVQYDVNQSTNLASITSIEPDATVADGVKKIDFSITFTLKPKDGFLGGNDVDVLAYETPGIGTGARLSQTVNTTTSYLDISRYVTVGGSSVLDSANFANVAIPASVRPKEGKLLVEDAHLEENTGVSINRYHTNVEKEDGLYFWVDAWQDPVGEDAWKAKYVYKVDVLAEKPHDDTQTYPVSDLRKDPALDLGEGPFAPEVNTHYTVTVGVGTNPAKIATVGPTVVDRTVTKDVNIFVRPRITFQLTNLTTNLDLGPDQCTSMDPSTEFAVTLSAPTGYALPEAEDLQVTYIKGGANVSFGYNAVTGQLTIPASSVAQGSIQVVADGVLQTYQIHYVYQLPGGTEELHTDEVAYNAAVTPWVYAAPEVPGHTFEWRWYTSATIEDAEKHGISKDGDVPTTMPARDIWVVGTYVTKTYQLQVNYVYKDTANVAAESYGPIDYEFGTAYSILSPAVSGHAAATTLLSGTVDANLIAGTLDSDLSEAGVTLQVSGNTITFTVPYESTTGRLRINYVYADTGEVRVEVWDECTVGETYTVLTPGVPGYTPDIDEIVWTATAEGYVARVTYTPNQYTLHFNTGEGGTVLEDRTVLYNSIYGYHMVKGEKVYDALPTQVLRPGYEFAGWYLNGVQVHSDTVVKTTEEHTLTAAWTPKSYALTIRFVYEDGTRAFEPYTTEVAYDQPYSYTAPTKTGFKPYLTGGGAGDVQTDTLEGVMPNQPVVRQFVYKGDLCPLTINYVYGDGITENRPELPTQQENTKWVRYMSPYSVESPAIDGFSAIPAVVSGTMDSLSGLTLTVQYYQNVPTVSVTVTWGELEFSCDKGIWNPETHRYDGVSALVPTSAGTNTVTVTNNAESEMDVRAAFAYKPRSDYQYITGIFTNDSTQNSRQVTTLGVPMGASKKVYLWLQGDMSNAVSGTIISGDCTVTITGGNETAGGGS